MTRYLFISTPVGPLGSGTGGGVEIHLPNLAQALQQQGDLVHVLAPAGSRLEGVGLTTVTGLAPDYAQNLDRDSPVEICLPSVLANLWELAHHRQADYDLILNWAYDWLPYYLTPFFSTPVAHFVSMSSLTQALDKTMERMLTQFPGSIGLYTQAQAATFSFAQPTSFALLPCGIDLQTYTFVPQATESLCWMGRIAPEKGIEDCAALSQHYQLPITVMGRIQDQDYWQRIQAQYPQALLDYRGFFATAEMQRILGQSSALLITSKWIEAFGIVAVEAMACGVPVITYRRGGPAELVADGETGWVVDPDDIEQLAAAVGRLDRIDRWACRQRVEKLYSLAGMRTAFKQWTDPLIARAQAGKLV